LSFHLAAYLVANPPFSSARYIPAVQIVAVDSSNNIFDVLSTAPFDPQNAWHSYRVEAKGTTIKFFVDGGLLLSADDSRFLNAGQIGLWSEYMQVKLSSFKITAL
jgi:hypothetical protein